MTQLTFGVRELQANIGDALRAAQRGDKVLITSRGRVVAVLAKADAALPEDSAVERKLRRMAAEGRIRLGKGGPIRRGDIPLIPGLVEQFEKDRR